MSKIFISYRREDSRGVTGRIYDRLENQFGQDRIFMDVDTIQPGMDFVREIELAVDASDVFLVVIGPDWENITDNAGNPRLSNPEDFVRLEVASALQRDIRIIPVLVDNAEMPRSDKLPEDLRALSRRNAIQISHTRFHMDMERLIRVIEQILPGSSPPIAAAQKETPKKFTLKKKGTKQPGSEPDQSAGSIWLTVLLWSVYGIFGLSLTFLISFGKISDLDFGAVIGVSIGSALFIGLVLRLRQQAFTDSILQAVVAVVGTVLIGLIDASSLLPVIGTLVSGLIYKYGQKLLRK